MDFNSKSITKFRRFFKYQVHYKLFQQPGIDFQWVNSFDYNFFLFTLLVFFIGLRQNRNEAVAVLRQPRFVLMLVGHTRCVPTGVI